MRTYNVQIKRSDIAHALECREKDSTTCPIAIALERATGVKWGVSRAGAHSRKFGRMAWPISITRWIDRYDAHEKQVGFTFSFGVDSLGNVMSVSEPTKETNSPLIRRAAA